jgi:ribosomal protein L4
VPRDLSININRKTRLLAIKTMLSVKLFEDKLIFINSEELPNHKTKLLAHCLDGFGHK